MPPLSPRSASARLARAYIVLNRRFEQGQRLADALFHGICLGFMDRESLAEIDASYYSTHHEPVNGRTLRYADPAHVRSGLSDWEASALQTYFRPGGRLVITSAGGGREILGAFELGFDAVGYEPHDAIRAAGSEVLAAESHPGTLRPCDRDRFPADAEPADGVIVGWGGYSHIPGAGRRIAFLRGARRLLSDDAPILLSFWMLPGKQRYLRTVHAAAGVVRRLTGGEPVELGDLLSPLYVHCFSEAQIRAECAAAGFGVETFRVAPYPHAVARAV